MFVKTELKRTNYVAETHNLCFRFPIVTFTANITAEAFLNVVRYPCRSCSDIRLFTVLYKLFCYYGCYH